MLSTGGKQEWSYENISGALMKMCSFFETLELLQAINGKRCLNTKTKFAQAFTSYRGLLFNIAFDSAISSGVARDSTLDRLTFSPANQYRYLCKQCRSNETAGNVSPGSTVFAILFLFV